MIDLGRTASGDLDFVSNGGRGRRVAGAEATGQFMTVRLQQLEGGWWRNTSYGLSELIYRKPASVERALSLIMDEARRIPGVVRLGDDWAAALDAGRALTYSGTAYTVDEELTITAVDESGLGLVLMVELAGPILG